MGRRRTHVLRAEAAGVFVLARRGARVPWAEAAGAVFAVLWRRGPKLLTGPHIVAFAGVEEIFVAG